MIKFSHEFNYCNQSLLQVDATNPRKLEVENPLMYQMPSSLSSSFVPVAAVIVAVIVTVST